MRNNDTYCGQSLVESGRSITGVTRTSCEHRSSCRHPSHAYPVSIRKPVPLVLRDDLVKRIVCNGRDETEPFVESTVRTQYVSRHVPGTSSCSLTMTRGLNGMASHFGDTEQLCHASRTALLPPHIRRIRLVAILYTTVWVLASL